MHIDLGLFPFPSVTITAEIPSAISVILVFEASYLIYVFSDNVCNPHIGAPQLPKVTWGWSSWTRTEIGEILCCTTIGEYIAATFILNYSQYCNTKRRTKTRNERDEEKEKTEKNCAQMKQWRVHTLL